jgi:thiamine-phosphate pyrophosphorylase
MKPYTLFDPTLYAIADASVTPVSTAPGLVKSALAGGVTVIQIRAKELGDSEFLEFARAIAKVAGLHGVPVIVNDRVEAVSHVGADGVHLGAKDMTVTEARSLLGDEALIGTTAHSMDEIRAAEGAGADYVGFGSIFSSPTKMVETIQGVEGIVEARKQTDLPIVAIGGITVDRTADVIAAGADGVAVIFGLWSAADAESRAREYLSAIEEGRSRR